MHTLKARLQGATSSGHRLLARSGCSLVAALRECFDYVLNRCRIENRPRAALGSAGKCRGAFHAGILYQCSGQRTFGLVVPFDLLVVAWILERVLKKCKGVR